MSGDRLYFEDLAVGQRFTSGEAEITEAEIKAFAARYDPQPFHLDDAAARQTLFGGLAASGWHTAAVTMRLLVESGAPLAGGLIGAGGEIAWPRPTRPGDVLHVESEVVALVPSRSKPERGMATLRSETKNQRGEVVQVLTAKLVAPRRPAGRDGTTRETRRYGSVPAGTCPCAPAASSSPPPSSCPSSPPPEPRPCPTRNRCSDR